VIALRRRIFKSQYTGIAALRELLQTMFIAEYLCEDRSKELWLVSPWISDIPLIDNRSAEFDTLNPEWGRREIRLSEILVLLMSRGSQIKIVTREADSNSTFLGQVTQLAAAFGVADCVRIGIRNELHTKGILLSSSQILGSMNLTHNGLGILDELVEFCIDASELAEMRNQFRHDYGEYVA
jgi:hypothetical protein